MDKNKRVSISFRKVKDRELYDILQRVEEGEVSKFLRGLIYDGLEYRKIYGTSQKEQALLKPPAVTEERRPEQAPQQQQQQPVAKPDVEKDDIEDKLDEALDF